MKVLNESGNLQSGFSTWKNNLGMRVKVIRYATWHKTKKGTVRVSRSSPQVSIDTLVSMLIYAKDLGLLSNEHIEKILNNLNPKS